MNFVRLDKKFDDVSEGRVVEGGCHYNKVVVSKFSIILDSGVEKCTA